MSEALYYTPELGLATYTGPVSSEGGTRGRFQLSNSSGAIIDLSAEEWHAFVTWIANTPPQSELVASVLKAAIAWSEAQTAGPRLWREACDALTAVMARYRAAGSV